MTCIEAEESEASVPPTLDTVEVLQTQRVYTFSKNAQPTDAHYKHMTTCFRVKMREPKYKSDFFHTVSLCLAFILIGAAMGQRGPSILDLQIITKTDVQQSSAFITVLSAGYTCGSVLAGFLHDRISKPLLLFINCLTTGLFIGVLPFCSNYILMLVITFVGAVPMAGIDVGGNADIIRMWGSESRSYMQAMHFCYAIGAIIGPLETEPFLTPRQTDDPQHGKLLTNTKLSVLQKMYYNITSENIYDYNATVTITEKPFHCNSTTVNTNSLTSHSKIQNSTINADNKTTIVYIAYIIVAAASTLISVPFLISYFQQPIQENPGQENVKCNNKSILSLRTFIITLILINVLNVFYVALEDTVPNFMLLFVVESLNWSKTSGSRITSIYWAAFAISRFLGIFIIRHFTPTRCLLIVYTSLLSSCIGLLFSAVHSFDPGVWVSVVGMGFSMGIIFPTNYTMFSDVVTLSGKIVSLISTTACVGSIGNPAILGPLMQHYSPMWYVYLILAESTACVVSFLVLLGYSKSCTESTPTKSVQLDIVRDNECQCTHTDVVSELLVRESNIDGATVCTNHCVYSRQSTDVLHHLIQV